MPVGVVLLVILASMLARGRDLGHPSVRDLDEVYHAIVARSMMEAPLTPRLYLDPVLPYDFRNWQGNHIWLHKPPVALWTMALSMELLGVSNFAMRLPSLLLAAGSAWLVFLIGRRLVDAWCGAFAACMVAINPAMTRLVQGQVFSDHVDVAMVFWSTLGVYLLLRAAHSAWTGWIVLAGVVQAVAWMTKSYPALFLTGLAGVMWLGPVVLRRWHAPAGGLRLSARQMALLLLSTLLTAAPWTLWCLMHFRREFVWEQVYVFLHLYENVEQFAAPWDRLLADYLNRVFVDLFPMVLASVAAVGVMAWRTHDARLIVLLAWWFGVLVPHTLAVSKTPTATATAWAAGWLLLGVAVSTALRHRGPMMVLLIVGGALALIWPTYPRASVMGFGSNYTWGSILVEHRTVFLQALASLAAALTLANLRSRWLTAVMLVLLGCVLLRHGQLAHRTAEHWPTRFVAFERLAREADLPADAVILVEPGVRSEHMLAMWWLDRPAYPLDPAREAEMVEEIRALGRTPLILSRSGNRPDPLASVEGEGALFAPVP